MRLFTILFCLILLTSLQSYSQTGRQVNGVVQDTANVTIPGAVVKLISPQDSVITSTDGNGHFSFASVKAKQFTLTVSSLGYIGLKRKYTMDADTKPVNLAPVKLHGESTMLKAVNIVQSNAIKVVTDTTEYKASAYPVEANAPVEDVIKKLPGVDVDKDGNITAEGKAVTKVRVNGKDFFGGDVKTATKNLPADVIESIQMIDDYGDQANLTGIKTGEPNKIMNIVIRKDKNYGYSLSATGGDGSDALPSNPGVTNDNRYLGTLNFFKFKGDQQIAVLGSVNNTNVNTFSFGGNNGGGGGGGRRGGGGTTTPVNGLINAKSLGINFRDQWGKYVSVYGSYSFAQNTTYTKSTNTQTPLSDGVPVDSSLTTNNDETLNHRFTFNVEIKPDTVNYIKIIPSFSYSSTTNNDYSLNNISASGVPITAYKLFTNGNSNSPNYGTEVLYNHRFNGYGRNFSIDVNVNAGPTNSYSNPLYQYSAGKPANAALNDQQINIHTQSSTQNINVSYIEPLSKVSYLEGNYAYGRSLTNTDKTTNLVDSVAGNPVITYSPVYSNTYNYTFVTNKFGLNYRYIKTNYNLTVGAAVQPGTLNGYSPALGNLAAVTTNVNTFNFIPSVRYVYNFSKSQALNISYNGYSNQPTYSELNPRLDSTSNRTAWSQGSPNLKPEFDNNYSIRYNKFDFVTGNVLFSNFSFTQILDKITTNTTSYSYAKAYKTNKGVTNLNGVTSTQYLNSDGYYTASGFFTFAKPWQQRKYTLNLNARCTYTNSYNYITADDSIGKNGNIAHPDTPSSIQKNLAKNLALTPGVRFRVSIVNMIDAELNSNYSINRTINSVQNNVTSSNSNFRTLTLGLVGKNYFGTTVWTFSYDYTKSINYGYTGSTNPNILNMYVERRFLKQNAATIRASVFDLFNENTGYSSSQNATTITTTNVNRLGRYYLLTLTIRLQKFAGKNPMQQDQPGRRYRDGGPGSGGPGGGGPGVGGGFGGGSQ